MEILKRFQAGRYVRLLQSSERLPDSQLIEIRAQLGQMGISAVRALFEGLGAHKATPLTLDILEHVSTANVARDMDQIRGLLGESKLNYLGFSYGTFLGATYANLFPRNYRAMVLDASGHYQRPGGSAGSFNSQQFLLQHYTEQKSE